MEVVVFIPTYNERDNLEPIVESVLECISFARVLIIDDASPDGTGDIADELSKRYEGRVTVLHRHAKDGFGRAYVDGFRYALRQWPEAEFFIQMDADFSHDPKYLQPMLEAARKADVVVGSRYVNGISIVNWPLNRLIVSKLGTAYAYVDGGCGGCGSGGQLESVTDAANNVTEFDYDLNGNMTVLTDALDR